MLRSRMTDHRRVAHSREEELRPNLLLRNVCAGESAASWPCSSKSKPAKELGAAARNPQCKRMRSARREEVENWQQEVAESQHAAKYHRGRECRGQIEHSTTDDLITPMRTNVTFILRKIRVVRGSTPDARLGRSLALP